MTQRPRGVASRWDGHHLLLAPLDEGPSGLVGWAERGLDRGDKMLFAGSAFGALDELVATLDAAGLDTAAAADEGRLQVVDPGRFYSPTGYPALVDEALRQGFRGVRSFGGPAAAADVLDGPAFEDFERVLERTWVSRGATAVCCYGRVPDELHRVVAHHSCGWSAQLLHAHSPQPGRLELGGEIDAATDRVLTAVCARVLDQAGSVLVVDCTALVFMSVSGWRALAGATEGFRRGGGRVRLVGLGKLPARTLQMMGYERAFELEAPR